jgi:hypothetical protein
MNELIIAAAGCGCDPSCCPDGDAEDDCCDEACCAGATAEGQTHALSVAVGGVAFRV